MSDDHVPYEPGMTLMPGQSTTLSVAVPPEIAEAFAAGHEVVFQQTPPLKRPPYHERAAFLGVPACLRVMDAQDREWRCGSCRLMQDRKNPQVWVPDFLRRGELLSVVREQARLNSMNGHFSAWCVKCAKKFKDNVTPRPTRPSWWRRLFARHGGGNDEIHTY